MGVATGPDGFAAGFGVGVAYIMRVGVGSGPGAAAGSSAAPPPQATANTAIVAIAKNNAVRILSRLKTVRTIIIDFSDIKVDDRQACGRHTTKPH